MKTTPHSPFSPRSGFTLIELLTVIAIVIVLASITVIGFNVVQRKALLSKTQVELKSMEAALGSYKADYGVYPESRAADCGGLVLYSSLYGDGEPQDGKAVGMDGIPDQRKAIYLKTIDPKDSSRVQEYALLDPWGNKYRYLQNPAKPRDQVNRDFDLWSIGPDGNQKIYAE